MFGLKKYFSRAELLLWSLSALLITVSFLLFDRENYLTLTASLIGVTSLIFSAKGNPVGQLLMVVFSLLYGIISYGFAYYGEMLTYMGMTMPMAVFALVSWLKNPYNENRSQVKVNSVGIRELAFMSAGAVAVTVLFYYVLRYFGTANLVLSTASVTTTFVAVYLTFRRSPWFAFAYALNDVILILLWTAAAFTDTRYISVTVCFCAFLVNDIYGFISWRKMKHRQREGL